MLHDSWKISLSLVYIPQQNAFLQSELLHYIIQPFAMMKPLAYCVLV